MKKRILSMILSGTVIFSLAVSPVLATESGVVSDISVSETDEISEIESEQDTDSLISDTETTDDVKETQDTNPEDSESEENDADSDVNTDTDSNQTDADETDDASGDSEGENGSDMGDDSDMEGEDGEDDSAGGITDQTITSDNDVFSEYDSDFSVSGINQTDYDVITQYYEDNGGASVFGENVDDGYTTNEGVSYIEYENAIIFTSSYGTFCVKLPILNVFISSGGVQYLGAPTNEAYFDSTTVWQTFEKGTLSYVQTLDSDTLVVRRDNIYYFSYSLKSGDADEVIAYGRSTDEVYVGDWNGDGADTLCVRRGNIYYFKNSISSGEADEVIAYGKPTDEVYVGDWDGDGVDTLCVRRGNIYYFKNSISSGEADEVIAYGKETDEVYVGDWDGDGLDSLCVRRENIYYIKNSLSSGDADSVIAYGKADDNVYVGTWQVSEQLEKLTATSETNLLLNSSQNFSYSLLTLAYAGNSVNSTSFRKSSITTYIDDQGNEIQYCAYYDYYGMIVVAQRTNSGAWTYQWTGLKGTISDAHNVISIAVDGDGYLHMAWSRHDGALMYVKAAKAGTLELEKETMIGDLENNVTYPEFYVLPDGDIFFLYRNGGSGNGNLVLNKYDTSKKTWNRVNSNLISGEGERSPYWQACVDSEGRLHISWVWRETANVSTNHDMCYAVSTDSSGSTFVNSEGKSYTLPITQSTAEVVCEIPQNSALMNQTSMTTDDEGNPYILSYWRVDEVVQYNILTYSDDGWMVYDTGIRTTDFTLSGSGTKSLPCARPQILVDGSKEDTRIYIIFRDSERDSAATIAKLTLDETNVVIEKMIDITGTDMGEWEPTYDIALWKQKKEIMVFMQKEFYSSDGSNESYQMEAVYVADLTSVMN